MREYDVDIRKLNNLSIYQLREVGAKVGVRNPTAMRSDELRESICDVVTGKIKPYLKTKSGRPHKEVISDAEWDDLVGFNNSYKFCNRDDMLSLYSTSSNIYPSDPSQIYEGYVMQIQGELIFAVGTAEQIRLNKYARINRDLPNYRLLQQGDRIAATLSPTKGAGSDPFATEIKSINGVSDFDELLTTNKQDTPQSQNTAPEFSYKYPQLKFLNNEFPVRAGQRALFIGEDKMSGQDFLANSLAKDLSRDYHIVYFSCNKMPEDKMSFNGNVEYFFSTFDINPRNLVFTFEVAFERARNLCQKKNTIFIVDDLNDIMSAYISLFENDKEFSIDEHYSEILQQLKVMYASSGINNCGSLTLFTFSSVPQDSRLANYLHDLDSLVNCHFILDKVAFLDGADEFLVKNECRIAKQKRTLVD